MTLRALAGLAAALLSLPALAQPLPPVAPDRAGFSADGLARIDSFFGREVAANRVPGAVVAIARDGKLVYYKALGYRDKAKSEPMTVDTIFALASMTKIMATVGGLDLAWVHHGRGITNTHFNQFFQHLLAALEELGAATDDVSEVVHRISVYKNQITGDAY